MRDRKGRELLKARILKQLAGSGMLLVHNVVSTWGAMIKMQRAKRAGKDSLMKQVMKNFATSERAIFERCFKEWAAHTRDEKHERYLVESKRRALEEKLQKMKVFEKMFAAHLAMLINEGWRTWIEEVAATKLAARLKQQGLDVLLRRIMSSNTQLINETFHAWVMDWRDALEQLRKENAEAAKQRTEAARQKALAHFAKSLDQKIAELQVSCMRAWLEVVDLRKVKQGRRKALLERIAREMLTVEMMVRCIFPMWVRIAGEAKGSAARDLAVKITLDKARKIIVRLRDATILRVFMISWYLRAVV
jgi:hypothetical protein